MMTLLFSAMTMAVASVASAQGPSFDCSKATGQVPTLVCKDAGLATLDRQLDGVYKAAMAKARDKMPAQLRSEQSGWIKGRDDCWKAQGPDNPVRLTLSWMATTVRECVEGSYRIRISELQARWTLVAAKPVSYACANNPANEVVATFFETDPKTVRLERGDRVVTAWMLPDGSKYEGPDVTLSVKGNEASVSWREESLQCRAR